jgi:tetratricopeptide (TPR) repeat protein
MTDCNNRFGSFARATLVAATIAVVGLASTGCKSNDMKTQKQVATQEWNGARAAVLFSLANDQYKTGNLDAARKSIDEALSLDPKNANLHLMSARIDVEQGKLESAQASLETARQIAPQNAEVFYYEGVINQRWQRFPAAYDSYAEASKLKPEDLAYVLAQAEMLVAMNRPQDAMKLLLDRTVYFEHSGAIRDAVGQLYERQGDVASAVDYYRQASVLEANDDAIRERLALALYRTSNWSDALSQLQRLLKNESHAQRADLIVAAGECELALGRSFEARERFEQASQMQASSPQAWLGIAKASLKMSDLRRAEMAATKAVALGPTEAQSHLMLGYVRLQQKQFDAALESFLTASKFDPKDTVALTMSGYTCEQLGQHDAALRLYGRALALDPADELAGKLMATAAGDNR